MGEGGGRDVGGERGRIWERDTSRSAVAGSRASTSCHIRFCVIVNLGPEIPVAEDAH